MTTGQGTNDDMRIGAAGGRARVAGDEQQHGHRICRAVHHVAGAGAGRRILHCHGGDVLLVMQQRRQLQVRRAVRCCSVKLRAWRARAVRGQRRRRNRHFCCEEPAALHRRRSASACLPQPRAYQQGRARVRTGRASGESPRRRRKLRGWTASARCTPRASCRSTAARSAARRTQTCPAPGSWRHGSLTSGKHAGAHIQPMASKAGRRRTMRLAAELTRKYSTCAHPCP